MSQRQRRNIHPRLHRTAVSSQFSAAHQQCFLHTDLLWLPAQHKFNQNSGLGFFKFKNVPVKSSHANCHELKTCMINTSNQKTNIEEQETIKKITKVLPNKLVNTSHRPTAWIFHNCIASTWESIKFFPVLKQTRSEKQKWYTILALERYSLLSVYQQHCEIMNEL